MEWGSASFPYCGSYLNAVIFTWSPTQTQRHNSIKLIDNNITIDDLYMPQCFSNSFPLHVSHHYKKSVEAKDIDFPQKSLFAVFFLKSRSISFNQIKCGQPSGQYICVTESRSEALVRGCVALRRRTIKCVFVQIYLHTSIRRKHVAFQENWMAVPFNLLLDGELFCTKLRAMQTKFFRIWKTRKIFLKWLPRWSLRR